MKCSECGYETDPNKALLMFLPALGDVEAICPICADSKHEPPKSKLTFAEWMGGESTAVPDEQC